jgi:hypothetical protein
MILILPLMFAVALVAVAPVLGVVEAVAMLAMLTIALSAGLALCRSLRAPAEPFLALVAGITLLGHVLIVGDAVLPGARWQVAVLLGVAGLFAWRRPISYPRGTVAALGLLVAVFTVTWCADIAPRARHLHATGILDFWIDVLVHAGTLAQFASPDAIGRGMVLMADAPRPLYHIASYLPPAMLSRIAGVSPLDAIMLIWIPLGVLVMACGVVALGLALGGPWMGAFALAAVAVMPDPGRFALHNGYMDPAWLLEGSPGTLYAVGVSCAALAALVRWYRDQRLANLALGALLTAGCFLTRVNVFVWLAPLYALGVVAGWQRLSPRLRAAGVALGLLVMIGGLIAISWPILRADPRQFLFSYELWVHTISGPTAYDGLYQALLPRIGRIGTGIVGLGLLLLTILGPWLPIFLALTLLLLWQRRWSTADALPWLLIAVAIVAVLLAPIARNGDIQEYRQRASPLLAVVIAIWSTRMAALTCRPYLQRLIGRRARIVALGLITVSLIVQAATISTAKRPHMTWGLQWYGNRTDPNLIAIVPLLHLGAATRRRFAFSNEPADARNIDDAARLVGFSGVPAYLSCPSFMTATGGAVAHEAARRLAVLDHLAHAPDLATLRADMREAGITDYIVNTASDLPFDPERRGAAGHSGDYALYKADPT